MTEYRKDLAILSENEVVELFVYFLTTARVQIDDPDHYGPMRLLLAAEKLRDFVVGRASPALQELFESTDPIIKKAHIVNYQEVIKNDFLTNMGYQKPTKANDKAKVLAGKIIYSKKDKIIESLMKGGMSKKEATKEYDENIAM